MAGPIDIILRLRLLADGVMSGLSGIGAKVTAVAAAVTTYFTSKLFAGAVSSAADLEAKLSEVKAVSGASAQEMQALRKAAEDAGATTKYSATEAATALGNLTRAGLSADQAMQALPATLQLAQAGGVDLGQAAEFITKAVMGMGLAFGDAGRVADVLAKGANASNTSVTGLAEALSYTAPIAKSVGLSLEQTVAIIGKFADAGIDASRAGTALNAILSQFSDPASKFRTELGTIGIITNDFGEALRQLGTKGAVGERAILAVGTEAGPALRSLLNQGIGALDELTGKLKNAKGSAAETAAVMGDNLRGALGGLSSAWETVMNALGTPTLPILKDGVNQLAAALSAAVSNGTVGKFGDALAAAFKAAIEWGTRFVGAVDFEAVSVQLQTFATNLSVTLDDLGAKAKNAGNVVQTAYGVMSAGGNTVLAGVYVLGAGFSSLVQSAQAWYALYLDMMSKVTFGEVSARYKLAADEVRVSAAASGAATDAFMAKARQAMDDAATAAESAQSGWDGLTQSQTQAAAQAPKVVQAQADVKAAVEATSSAASAAGAAASAAGEAAKTGSQAQQAAAEAAREKVATLRAEYEKAVDAGEWQRAAEIQRQLTAALQGTTAATKESAAAAKVVEGAFERLGITSVDRLTMMADAAKRDYQIIRDAGTTAARDKQAAFEKYASAAIAANGGVVTAELRAQAAAQGMGVAVDEAGHAVVKSLSAIPAAADAATEAMRKTREEAEKTASAVVAVVKNSAVEKRNGEVKSLFDDDYRKRTGDGTTAGGNTLMSVINDLKGYGLDDEAAQQIAREFVDASGNVPYMNNPGQRKYGGPGGGRCRQPCKLPPVSTSTARTATAAKWPGVPLPLRPPHQRPQRRARWRRLRLRHLLRPPHRARCTPWPSRSIGAAKRPWRWPRRMTLRPWWRCCAASNLTPHE
ncbi:phage tail tape measure protein [Vitreoscilla filiformis]|uniref:Phage tail tape measure protein n=1 Tax=Vitreoscilla filiformis TaxID=63 RepID=A0A221KA30_VITFI|nr:phage tail tape measure protein [Vitreoscilla filiformis]ASM75881.1 phage tail tape measure protein [Vitreoscilla filiformis]ASM76445.1 phage tail tape measure protein [Vitreoscilla filiformis]ASM77320.1 phage tail tape measure protein [Vitreoscilla filiformis]